MRKRYARRQQLLLRAAAQHLGGQIVLRPDAARLQQVGPLADPTHRDQGDAKIAEKIAAAGVTVSPLSAYDVVGKHKRQGLMFGYAAVPDARIAPGIKAIAAALRLR